MIARLGMAIPYFDVPKDMKKEKTFQRIYGLKNKKLPLRELDGYPKKAQVR